MKITHQNHRIIFAILLALGLYAPQMASAQPNMGISRRDFYEELSPYGRWMNYPSYGQVWQPRVGRDFQPYATNGHWEMTEYGNTWVSDYPWGWAAFHYGRWQFDDYYGWLWLPDSEWGPAWVSWRSGGGYYGWAALGFGMGLDIGINIRIPYNYWTFVPDIYIRHPRVYSYCISRNRIGGLFGNTVIINNYYNYNNRRYVSGPYRDDIERITHNRVEVRRAEDIHRQERNNGRNNGRNGQDMAGGYGNSRQNSEQRPNQNRERIQTQDNARTERTPDISTYQQRDRGNAQQRTWGDNGNQQPQARANQVPQSQNQDNGQQRRRGNGDYGQQPQQDNNNARRNNDSYQQQPRANRESEQPRAQPQERNQPERGSTENRGGRRHEQ